MTYPKNNSPIMQAIESLQLSSQLLHGIENTQQSEDLLHALRSLNDLSLQWN